MFIEFTGTYTPPVPSLTETTDKLNSPGAGGAEGFSFIQNPEKRRMGLHYVFESCLDGNIMLYKIHNNTG
jgi:hypothetical protein